MVTRKYTRDYRVELYVDHRGRIREKAVYCGAYYKFSAKPDVMKKRSLALAILSAAVLLTTVLPMFIWNTYMKQFYVFLPQALTFIPIYMLIAGIYRIYTAKTEVTHEHCDKIANRISKAAVFLLVISIVALISAVVYCILGTPALRDWLLISTTVLRLLFAALLFSIRTKFAMEELPENPKRSEGRN